MCSRIFVIQHTGNAAYETTILQFYSITIQFYIIQLNNKSAIKHIISIACFQTRCHNILVPYAFPVYFSNVSASQHKDKYVTAVTLMHAFIFSD